MLECFSYHKYRLAKTLVMLLISSEIFMGGETIKMESLEQVTVSQETNFLKLESLMNQNNI
jgi:hypothetical protein